MDALQSASVSSVTEECRILSMNYSHEESNKRTLKSLQDLQEQDAILSRELNIVSTSDGYWRGEAEGLKQELAQLRILDKSRGNSRHHRRDSSSLKIHLLVLTRR